MRLFTTMLGVALTTGTVPGSAHEAIREAVETQVETEDVENELQEQMEDASANDSTMRPAWTMRSTSRRSESHQK